jgi:Flp pilus assembly protein TadG
MNRSLIPFLHREDGASAIEFALVIPIFLSLTFGIVVYAGYFASLSIVQQIAYEAARASVTGLTDAERQSLATQRATQLVASYGGVLNTASVTIAAAPTSAGSFAVTVSQQFNAFGLGNISALLPMPPTQQSATVEVARGGY